ncbi:cytosol aminopeptidase-like [Diorhabda carinulata]|uniref:cytosol aminopeptidase-like n=1 Tax=Diorhabda carinulata TaxID=1163345 RepID=UPI0025A1F01A|nr:cytosol aminopeptidase-like [Diorhabda carinulata]
MAAISVLRRSSNILSKNLICTSYNIRRSFCSDDCTEEKKGIILGVYEGENDDVILTKAASKFNDHLGGKLYDLIKKAGTNLKITQKGHGKIFNNIDKEFWSLCVVGLGKENLGYNELEAIDEGLEAVRQAAGTGAQLLKNEGVTRILIEGLGHPEQAAEGSALALWRYQENRSRQYWQVIPTLELFDDCDAESFQRGLFKAESQNLARRLSDTPANQMTPLHFAQETVNELCPCGIKVHVHDKDWIETKKMHLFLTAARGSCEPPVCLEISYCGASMDSKPILMVGKGVTFDSGGLCLKRCENMPKYRGDMCGAACIVAAIRAASALSLPINIEGVILLCENMPSGMAMRCGDVVMGLNQKSVMITDTDNEGRLMLADAFVFGQIMYKPRLIIDVATLTPGSRAALGSAASGVFTNSQTMWSQTRKAGIITGDRVWRLPLWKYFMKKVNRFTSHDVNNKGLGHGSACLGAAFLNEFVDCVDWIHFDTTGVGLISEHKNYSYLTKGRMTGRPTRTLIQLLYQLACPSEGQRKIE